LVFGAGDFFRESYGYGKEKVRAGGVGGGCWGVFVGGVCWWCVFVLWGCVGVVFLGVGLVPEAKKKIALDKEQLLLQMTNEDVPLKTTIEVRTGKESLRGVKRKRGYKQIFD